MKHLKNVVTVLLALIMALSSVGVLAEDAKVGTFSDIEAGTNVSDAVMKLVGYGVITGYEDGTFKPNDTITRAEFAAVITRFKGIANDSAQNVVTGFSDLDNDDSRAWARPYVKAAVDAKIINGFPDGTFRAAEPVTYEQAVKMIICAIGYEPVAQSEYSKQQLINPTTTTWSTGYIMTASKQGVTKNAATAEIAAPASRGTVAILTSNAYDVPKLEVTEDGDGNLSYEQGDGSVGEDQYNTQEIIKGTVTATYYTSLTNTSSGLEMNEVEIENTKDGKVRYEMTDSLAKSANMEKLLGRKVTVNYAKDEFALVAIQEDPNTNSILEIKEQMINRPMRGADISYVDSNGKNRSVNLDGYAFIYNGKSIPANALDQTIPELDNKSIEDVFQNGTIELNESTKVMKINSYKVFVVSSHTKLEGKETVSLKYTLSGEPTTFEYQTVGSSARPEIYVNGNKQTGAVTFSANNIINYLESPTSSTPKIKKIYATTTSKTGELTSGLTDGRIVDIDYNEMCLTNAYAEYIKTGSDVPTFELGDRYTYFLDYTGQIAAINVASTSYSFGYVMGADDETIQILDASGTIVNKDLSASVKIDGQPGVTASNVAATLISIADSELQTSTKHSAGDIAQPIRYSLSSKGTVSVIDTVKENNAGGSDTFTKNQLFTGTNVNPNKSSVTMGGKIYQFDATSTKVFFVPDNKAKDDYSVLTVSSAFNIPQDGGRAIEIFGANESDTVKTAQVVILYAAMDPSYVITGGSAYMIVTDEYNGSFISGYLNAGTTQEDIYIDEDNFITDSTKAWVNYADIKKGDVIRYIKKGTGGKVVAIEQLYKAGTTSFNDNVPGNSNGKLDNKLTTVSSIGIFYREVLQKNDAQTKIFATDLFSGTDDEKQSEPHFFSYPVAKGTTTCYYYDGSTLTAGKDMNFVPDGSKVIIFRRGSSSDDNIAAVYVLKASAPQS